MLVDELSCRLEGLPPVRASGHDVDPDLNPNANPRYDPPRGPGRGLAENVHRQEHGQQQYLLLSLLSLSSGGCHLDDLDRQRVGPSRHHHHKHCHWHYVAGGEG